MLDLSSLPSQAVMRLAKASPKREGAGLSWDIDLCMEVATEEDAMAVDAYLPGAASAFAARSDSKGGATTSGGFDMMRVALAGTDGEQLATCHAEVRKCAIKVTASQGVLTVGLRLHGLVQDAAMSVVYQLDEQIQVRLQSHSTQLSLLPAANPHQNLVGWLLVHQFDEDTVIAGICSEHKDSTYTVATLEDADHVTFDVQGKLDSTLQVCVGAGEDMRDLLVGYIERCDEARIPASWLDIVQAMGEQYASGDVPVRNGTAWQVTGKLLDFAFDVASKRAAKAK